MKSKDDRATKSELVQLKLNIGASVGDSTPTEVEIETPAYRSGSLEIDEESSENNPFYLFLTERIEDYIALILALTIVILVLVFP